MKTDISRVNFSPSPVPALPVPLGRVGTAEPLRIATTAQTPAADAAERDAGHSGGDESIRYPSRRTPQGGLFTAAQLAAAVAVTPQTLRGRLAGIAPDGELDSSGNAARAWCVASLPSSLLADLGAAWHRAEGATGVCQWRGLAHFISAPPPVTTTAKGRGSLPRSAPTGLKVKGWKAGELDGLDALAGTLSDRLTPGEMANFLHRCFELLEDTSAGGRAGLASGLRTWLAQRVPALAMPKRTFNNKLKKWKAGGRKGDWKLVISQWQPKLQLFNLADDIGEKHDLANEKPELVQKLHQAWRDWSAPLPPRANPPAAKSGKSGEGNKVADSEKPPPDRGALFETKDQNHDDKLSLEEFLTGQADQEAARPRFEKWDTDKDGFLTREEFVNMGGKSK